MKQPVPWYRWRPSPVGAIAGGLVILGFALPGIWGVSWWFFSLCAVGAFGPGILREVGWLRDKDEFQRRADHRAGYHAYLVTGVAAVLLEAYVRSGSHKLKHAEELSFLYLFLLWFTWMFSSLMSYWGARKTASRILIIFGSGWAVFNIVGDFRHPVTMAMQLLVTTCPFFILAWVARRWPRVAGALMVAVSVAFTWMLYRIVASGRLSFVVEAGVAVIFVGPILMSGLALLRSRPEDGDEPAVPAPAPSERA